MTNEDPRLGCLLEIVETLVLTLIIFWVIQSFVAQPFKVQQESMERTLLARPVRPRRQADAALRTPTSVATSSSSSPPATGSRSRGEPYIKRVIGVGGDTVEIHDGAVFVNGTELVEPYVFQEDGRPQPTDDLQRRSTAGSIPAGQLFLMGDHRENSSDSRECGPVDVCR